MHYLAAATNEAPEQDHCQVARTGQNFHIMRKPCPIERLLAVAGLLVLAAGCQQADQTLPFELAAGEGATLTIGTSGGTISVPPSFSLSFPAGALTASVSVDVTPRVSAPFPSDAGIPVPGSAFDVGPVGTILALPARVEIGVPADLLEPGDDVRLSVALLRQDGSVATFGGTYDVTNGILTAEIDELGPVAAVISADAIPVLSGVPDSLSGGSFPPPPPAPPAPSGAALANHGGIEFSASCSLEARQCFTSGLIRVWADDTVRGRLGDDLFLLNPNVQANFDFVEFDQNGVPISVVGSVSIDGDLRARLNSTVSSYGIEDGATTGQTADPTVTTVQVTGNLLILGETMTSAGDIQFNEEVRFGITGIGTSEMLTLEFTADVEFDNDDGSVTVGQVTAHIRLRR